MSAFREPDKVCMLQGTIVVETAKAMLIEIEEAEYWIPLSQLVRHYLEPNAEGLFTFWAKKWICDKNHIPYDEEQVMTLEQFLAPEVQEALESGEQFESEEARMAAAELDFSDDSPF